VWLRWSCATPDALFETDLGTASVSLHISTQGLTHGERPMRPQRLHDLRFGRAKARNDIFHTTKHSTTRAQSGLQNGYGLDAVSCLQSLLPYLRNKLFKGLFN
jgi:hypothetical protein